MEEEVDLRDYINVLVKWKWLIIWITVISMLVAGVYSYVVVKPVYEASGSLLINPQNADISITTPDQLLNPLTFLPQMSVETYMGIIKSANIEENVLNALKLDSPPYNITLYSLNKMIKVQNPKNTSLIKLYVDYKDPKVAKEIVEDLLKETVSYVNFLNSSRLRSGGDVLKKQFLDANTRLENIEKSIAEFNSQKDNLSILKQERSSYKSALSSYLSQLLSLNSKINQYKEQLSTTERELKSESKFITAEKSILDDPLLSQLAQDLSNEDIVSLSELKVSSQEVNPVYINLKVKLVNYAITLSGLKTQEESLNTLILQARDKIHKLDEEINEKQLELNELNRELSIAKSDYSKIAANYEQLKLTQDNMLTPLSIAEEPVVPTHPIKPKKLFNIAVAGTAGFFFAILLAFFLEYMQGSGDNKEKERENT